MKIAKIEIKNFRGIGNYVLNPDDVNVILGRNGAGKTSLLRAIKFALTGEITEEDIKRGASEAIVEVELEDGSSILRKKKEGRTDIKVNGKTTTQKACNDFIETKFGAKTDVIASVCGSEFYEGLDTKELTKFILSILPIQVSYDIFSKLIKDNYKPTDAQEAYIKSHFENKASITICDVDALYKEAFAERRTKNAIVKDLKVKAAFDDTTLPKESKEDLNKMLSDALHKEELMSKYNRDVEIYNRSVNAKAEAESKLAALHERLNSFINVQKPDASYEDNLKVEKTKFQNAILQSQGIMATSKNNIAMFERTLTNLDKPICPLSEKLICSTDKTGLKLELTKLVADNKKAVSDCESFITRCKEAIAERDNKLSVLNNQKVQYKEKELLEKQIQDFVIPEVLEKPEAPSPASIDKNEIERKLAIISQYEAAQNYKKELSKAVKEVAVLDWACETLNEKGVRSQILSMCLSPLEKMANDKAAKLKPGFTLSFSSEKGLDIRVSPKGDGKFVGIDKVSSGEFIYAAYLIMAVVKEITGIKILMIDNIDKLDKTAFEAFISLIKADGSYDNVFIAGVDHDDTAPTGVNVVNL